MQIKNWLVISLCIAMSACANNHMPQNDDDYSPPSSNSIAQNYSGSGDELYRTGYQYEHGIGVPRDESKALQYYVQAGQMGSAKAQFEVGTFYRGGRGGVQMNYVAAFMWLQRSAELGNIDAQNSLGVCYLLGQGTAQDYNSALAWFQKAAEQNNASAQNELGYMYVAGKGVPQDDATGMQWYQKAANQGLASAQYSLGLMYLKGLGTPANKTQAIAWFQKSAAQGFAPAKRALQS